MPATTTSARSSPARPAQGSRPSRFIRPPSSSTRLRPVPCGHLEDAKRPNDEPDAKEAEHNRKATGKTKDERSPVEEIEKRPAYDDGQDSGARGGDVREAHVQASLVW